jgi:hypothetical protein
MPPPELEGLASLLDAQSGPVRDIFAYCLCLMMVEIGRMNLAHTLPGEVSPICLFSTVAGDTFSVHRPPMSQEQEGEMVATLREILKDEGML